MRKVLAALALTASLSAVDEKPWLAMPYQSEYRIGYLYSHFSSVSKSLAPLGTPQDYNLLYQDVSLVLGGKMEYAMGIDFSESTTTDWGYQDFTLQTRYQFLNDLEGDFASMTAGVLFRQLSGIKVRDINVPYHGNVSVEALLSMGREFNKGEYWQQRIWGYAGYGIANKGAGFLDLLFEYGYNYQDRFQIDAFAMGYMGFGKQGRVDIPNFRGWAKIRHRSIDVGAFGKVRLGVWGSLGMGYTRRVFARAFPKNVNFITFRYQLPFSIF